MTKIFYNEESNKEFISGIKKLTTTTENDSGKMRSDFKGITNNGLADQTVSDLGNGFEELGGLLGETGTIYERYTGAIFDGESKNAQEIDGMNIPKDFLAENAAEVNYYNTVLLSKIDGRSVTEGQKTEKANEVADSEVVKEGLTDINNNVTQGQTYDETSRIVGQSMLGNINGNVIQGQVYDDASQVSSERIRNINGNETVKQEADTTSQIINNNLGNISGSETVKQEADTRSQVMSNNLGNINRNTVMNQNNINTTSSIVGESLLGNVKGEKEKAKQEVEITVGNQRIENKPQEEQEKKDSGEDK